MKERRNGTLRSRRLSKDLLDSPVQIDQRSFADLLGYMAAFLQTINYYNLNNNREGHWVKMLEADPIIYMVTIINQPTSDLNAIIQKQSFFANDDEKNQEKLITSLLSWYETIQTWHDKLDYLGEAKLAFKINNVIRDILDSQKQSLLQLNVQLTKDLSSGIGTQSLPDTPLHDNEDLLDILHNFNRVIIHIKEITKEYLEQHIFEKNDHTANNAMYIAFLLMYKNVQNRINALARKHLDFYYQDVLLEDNQPGKATKTIVAFDLQPTVSFSLVEKGTLLSAGKLFGSKEDIQFKTDKPLVAYQLELKELLTLLFNRSPYITAGTQEHLVSSIQQKTLLHQGKMVTPKKEWYAFGMNKQSYQNTQVKVDDIVEIGFILGSPALILSEGKREINIQFYFDEVSAKDKLWTYLHEISASRSIDLHAAVNYVFEDAFDIHYTSKKGWQDLDNYGITFDEDQSLFSIQVILESADPPVELSPKIEEDLTWPSFKIKLNEHAAIYAYSFFQDVELDSIVLDVAVTRMRDFSLYNQLGQVSSKTSFEPFGPTPEVGSYLMIGNKELFQKQLTDLEIQINWEGIPSDYGGFDTYYNGYSVPIGNSSFIVQKSALSENYWLPMKGQDSMQSPLFQTEACTTPEGYDSVQLKKTSSISFNEINTLGLRPNYDLKTPLTYSLDTQSGFIRLSLIAPMAGFGSELYFKDYTEIATFNAKNKIQFPLPNKPYSPKASAIEVNYKAQDILFFKDKLGKSRASNENQGELIHISPFGLEPALANKEVIKHSLMCNYSAEGYLMFALSGIHGNTNIALYFQFLRSSTTVNLKQNQLKWEYKRKGVWFAFKDGEIIRDDTNNFTKSGIIELIIPINENDLKNSMSDDDFWIRISTNEDVQNFPLIQGIFLNAAEVTCTSTATEVLGQVIPANSIKKTVEKMPDIKGIQQPVETGNGVLSETGEQFYTRVHERLRHKGRAVSIWDYERLVLENFDAVKVVKCTNMNQHFRQETGKVKVIVLSERWTRKERHYFSESVLVSMQNLLAKQSNSLIEIQVMNPVVEYLLVNVKVVFMPEDNGGYYLNKLNEDISDYLSPFSEIDRGIGGIGGKIVPTMVSSFIEGLDYIYTVKDMNIEHIVRKGINNYTAGVYHGSTEINTTTPWSIFSPVDQHNIENILNRNDDSKIKTGIGSLQIGLDFMVGTVQDIASAEELVMPDESKSKLPNDSIFVFKHKTE